MLSNTSSLMSKTALMPKAKITTWDPTATVQLKTWSAFFAAVIEAVAGDDNNGGDKDSTSPEYIGLLETAEPAPTSTTTHT